MLVFETSKREKRQVRLPAPPPYASPCERSEHADLPLFLRLFCSVLGRSGLIAVDLRRSCRDQTATRRGVIATAGVVSLDTTILPLSAWRRPVLGALLALALTGCDDRCRDSARRSDAVVPMTCDHGAVRSWETHGGVEWQVCRCVAPDAGSAVQP